MPTLFSYCIPYDDGAAPNPFWGKCTLVICKPIIRRIAEVGDWVVGTGAKTAQTGDFSGRLVYAMRITEKMRMEEYDYYTKHYLPKKIPDWSNHDHRRRLGDSIYDFSTRPPILRQSVHTKENMKRDLGGEYALLSDHFFYFGDAAIFLPDHLTPIIKQGQGHKSKSNATYFDKFVQWIHSRGYQPNTLVGNPQIDLFADETLVNYCATGRNEQAKIDENEDNCEK